MKASTVIGSNKIQKRRVIIRAVGPWKFKWKTRLYLYIYVIKRETNIVDRYSIIFPCRTINKNKPKCQLDNINYSCFYRLMLIPFKRHENRYGKIIEMSFCYGAARVIFIFFIPAMSRVRLNYTHNSCNMYIITIISLFYIKGNQKYLIYISNAMVCDPSRLESWHCGRSTTQEQIIFISPDNFKSLDSFQPIIMQ